MFLFRNFDFCRLEVSLVNEDDDEDGADGRDQKHNVEPAMVKIELQVAQDFGDDGSVLLRHVHTH